MDLLLNDDQSAIAEAVARMVERHGRQQVGDAAYLLQSPSLEAALVDSDFLNVGRTDGWGVMEAIVVVEGLAQSAAALEAGASAIVAPGLGAPRDLPRSVALIDVTRPGDVRHLSADGSALILTPQEVRLASGGQLAVEPVDTVYAYPMGRAQKDPRGAGEVLPVDPAQMRRLWRLALGAEAVGLMRAALDLVVGYVKTRKQFGQPIGVFQTIQHRLSECEVLVRGSWLLVQEAAFRGTEETAAFAALMVQQAATRLVYETHQFHGAIGLTLEYPLHYWTYRLRVLQGELGGPGGQGVEAASLAWPPERPVSRDFVQP